MDKLRAAVIGVALAVGMMLIAGCQRGPVQKAGERVDRALDQDRVFGKGRVEKAGKKVDKTVDELKR